MVDAILCDNPVPYDLVKLGPLVTLTIRESHIHDRVFIILIALLNVMVSRGVCGDII